MPGTRRDCECGRPLDGPVCCARCAWLDDYQHTTKRHSPVLSELRAAGGAATLGDLSDRTGISTRNTIRKLGSLLRKGRVGFRFEQASDPREVEFNGGRGLSNQTFERKVWYLIDRPLPARHKPGGF